MRNFDLAPLYRHTVGFDRLANMLDSVMQSDQSTSSYPPFNIEKIDDTTYSVQLAVAGFTEDEINIETKDGSLMISGAKVEDESTREFLHRGIATRAFERRFQLADHVRVEDATLANGLLFVTLVREVPEALKPRQIKVKSMKSLPKSGKN